MAPLRSLGNTASIFDDFYGRSGTEASHPIETSINVNGVSHNLAEGAYELTSLDEVVLRVNTPVPVHIYAWGGGGGEGRSPSNYTDRRSAGGGSAGSAGGSMTLQPGTDYILRVGGGGLCAQEGGGVTVSASNGGGQNSASAFGGGGGGGASSIHTPQYRLIIAGGGGGGGHASNNTHALPAGGGYGGGETGGRSPGMAALPTLHGHAGEQTTFGINGYWPGQPVPTVGGQAPSGVSGIGTGANYHPYGSGAGGGGYYGGGAGGGDGGSGISGGNGGGGSGYVNAKYLDNIFNGNGDFGDSSDNPGAGFAADGSPSSRPYRGTAGDGGESSGIGGGNNPGNPGKIVIVLDSSATPTQTYWYANINGTGAETGYGIATDSFNNIYVTGNTSSTGSGNQDLIITKLNSSGVNQWIRCLGGAGGSDRGRAIAVDSSNNVYACGETASVGAGHIDALLVKYNAFGSILWQRMLGHANNDVGKAIAIDSSDNIYMCGDTTVTGDSEIFIAKYNSSGTIQWQRTLGGTDGSGNNNTYVYSAAIDGSDNLYIFGDTNVEGEGDRDMIVAKYNSSGTIQWVRTLGSTVTEEGYGCDVDSAGNVYICGRSNTSATVTSMIVAKYNTSGSLQWQRKLDAYNQATLGYAITVDNSGNVYAGGHTNGAPTIASYAFLIAKYNSSGVLQWQRAFGSGSFERVEAITTDSLGNICVTGLSNTGNNSVLVVKLPADGSLTGTFDNGNMKYEVSTLDESLSTLDNNDITVNTLINDAAVSLTSNDQLELGGLIAFNGGSSSIDIE